MNLPTHPIALEPIRHGRRWQMHSATRCRTKITMHKTWWVDTTEEKAPPAEQPNAWFNVLHRLAQRCHRNSQVTAGTADALRQDIAECLAHGWVAAVEAGSVGKIHLVLSPKGREIYGVLCQESASEGRPVAGWTCTKGNAAKWAAAGSVDTGRSFLRFFKRYKTDVARRRMAPGRLVNLSV